MENLQFEFLSRNETLSADTYTFQKLERTFEAKTRGRTFFEYQLQECGSIARSSVIKLNNWIDQFYHIWIYIEYYKI